MLSSLQQKKLLSVLLPLLAILLLYRFVTHEPPRTAPLAYQPGAVARSTVREGILSRSTNTDPLELLMARHDEKYPGIIRDIFSMERTGGVKIKKEPITVATPTQSPPLLPPPPPPPPPAPVVVEPSPEEIAANAARADLARFKFLGYLTDKESTLFLSKDGELFMVKAGDRIQKSYQVKVAGRDAIVLFDTATRVEVRIDLSGGEAPAPAPVAPTTPKPQPAPAHASQPHVPQNMGTQPAPRPLVPQRPAMK